MNNQIYVNLARPLGSLDRNVFGGFAEHLGRCIYGGIYEPGSPLADANGLRTDVLAALRRLKMPLIRYPGGNFVSGYRWRDGVGPRDQRPARTDMAWHTLETNQFGTNEFVDFCRAVEPSRIWWSMPGTATCAKPATGWNTATARAHRPGQAAPASTATSPAPGQVLGHRQRGGRSLADRLQDAPDTPAHHRVRQGHEVGRPGDQADRHGVSNWDAADFVERGQLLLEQAGGLIDYLAIHWYVDNPTDDFAAYMTLSEFFEDRLSAYEGLIRAVTVERKLSHPIAIAVDEWNVWHRQQWTARPRRGGLQPGRRAGRRYAAQRLYPPRPDGPYGQHRPDRQRPRPGLYLAGRPLPANDLLRLRAVQHLAGSTALDIAWDGATFAGGAHSGVRLLDVTATLSTDGRQLVLFVINRAEAAEAATEIRLAQGRFGGEVRAYVVNGPDIKATNGLGQPGEVYTREQSLQAAGSTLSVAFEPHSLTALVCPIV